MNVPHAEMRQARRAESVAGTAAVLLIPAGALLAPDVAEGLFYLLALAGAARLYREGPAALRAPSLRLLTVLGACFFGAALLSLPGSGGDPPGYRHLDQVAHFLAAPFFALLLYRAAVSARQLLAAVKFAALLVGVVAIVQFVQGNPRPGGAVNPLLFGALSLLLGFFSLVRVPLETTRQKALSLLAFCAGGTACALSQSRGVWFEAVFLLIVLLYIWSRAGLVSARRRLGICAAFLALVTAAFSAPLVQERVGTTVAEYHALHDHGDRRNSLAIRLVMWQCGLRAAAQRPLFGWGFDRTPHACAAVLDDAAVREAVLQYTHLHNEYITALAGKGIAGLASLLLLLLAPAAVFIRQAHRRPALAFNGIGALLCAGYALSGLSNLAFGHDVMNIFFLTFLSLTLPGAARCDGSRQPRRAPPHDKHPGSIQKPRNATLYCARF